MNKGIFAENLKFYRKKQGITQAALGEKSGVGQVSIANYERGSRFPGEKTIIILAETLGISLDLLFSGYNQNQGSVSKMTFSMNQLIQLLLNDSLKDSLTYINGWKKMNNYSLEESFSKIIIPLLQETGDKWQSGEISISEEHLISAKIREIISLLSSVENNVNIVDSSENNIWMGFCAPSDKHDILLFMLSHLLKSRGWKTLFIGTDVPVNDILSMVTKYRPGVICISISMELFQDGLDAYLQKIDESDNVNCPIVVCGKGADKSYESKYQKVSNYASTFTEGFEALLNIKKLNGELL